MTSSNLYQLAKQGDPNAIALYLNERLSDRNLTTQAKRNDECLVLTIAFEIVGDRETIVDAVRRELIDLESRSITKVRMGARQIGKKDFAWQAEFDLDYPKPFPSLDLSLDDEEAKDGLHGVGDVIRDRYRILEILGQGGNGITYAATDLQQNKKVAVKALSLRHMNDWKQIELFEREAKVLSQLDHVAIPKYFDFFTIDTEEDRAFYIVQELALGQNLAKLIEAGWRTNEKGVKKIAEQVLNILIYLHGLSPSVIHRDIKPHNLIYGDDGKVSLVDFGAVQDTYRSTMARGSTVIGTFGYMAPEQFRGQAVSATDLFSLGATILFILTHRSPSELPQERLRYDFRSKIKVSEQFADWLQKMVEPDLGDRFTSADESLATLQKKQIVWFPRRRLSWQAWVAIVSIGSISAVWISLNKWIILELFDIYPKICLSQGNESNIKLADIQQLVEYAKEIKNLPAKFPSQATEQDRCLKENFNEEILDILSHRGVKLDYNELLQSDKAEKFIDWLMLKRVDTNTKYKDNKTALSIVVHSYLYLNKSIDILKIAKTLIENGADVNNRDDSGKTPLHYAAFADDIKVAMFLIKNGADININDRDGISPLGYSVIMRRSVIHENIGVFKALIESGANINTRDKKGITPLHYAVAGTQPNCLIEDRTDNCLQKSGIGNMSKDRVEILIKKGADINAKDNNGNTPLDYAFKASYKRESPYYGIINKDNNKNNIIHLLIKNRADINSINNQNYWSIIKADQEIFEDQEILNFLIKKGMKLNNKLDSKFGQWPANRG
jgi:ankyrin repeat protein